MTALADHVAPRIDAPCISEDEAGFDRAVREQFGMVRSFWLSELGPRAVMLACRDAKPRSAAERERLAALHRWANRRAEREAPILPRHR